MTERWEYGDLPFHRFNVAGSGWQWAMDAGNGTVRTLQSCLNEAGAVGWELVGFTPEPVAHSDSRMYIGFAKSVPTVCHAILKRRID